MLRGRAWQALHHELSRFVTLSSPRDAVRDDLIALAHILPALAPLDAHSSRAALADRVSRQVGTSLNGAVTTMTDIGNRSAEAFTTLARTGALRINARELPRDLVTDDPNLAEARLRSALVVPPAALTNAVLGVFDEVRGHPIAAVSATALAGRVASPVEREVEAAAPARVQRAV